MSFKSIKKSASVVSALAILGTLSACDGGNTAGGGGGDTAGEFSGDTSGRIVVSVNEQNIAVGNTSGFSAAVYDAQNRPAVNVPVVCDSEAPVAIIEPTTGQEFTSTYGAISGIIGCRQPGSYQFACGLRTGGKRQFVDIKCSGAIPEGFTAWPGAAGGNLGGGVVPPDAGGPGGGSANQIRIASIAALNVLGEETSQIDTVAGICDQGTAATTDDTAEPFSDDSIKITVTNVGASLIRLTHYNYTVDNGRADGGDARSPNIAITGDIAVDGSTTFEALFLDAATGGLKTFADGSTFIPEDLGFRNVTIRVYGEDPNGDEVVVTSSIGLSFDNFNVCTS